MLLALLLPLLLPLLLLLLPPPLLPLVEVLDGAPIRRLALLVQGNLVSIPVNTEHHAPYKIHHAPFAPDAMHTTQHHRPIHTMHYAHYTR